jgi:hypothetical protein
MERYEMNEEISFSTDEQKAKQLKEQKKITRLSKAFDGPLDLEWENVAFYRKWWFMIICWLFFVPLIFVIDLTGKIYRRIDGKTYSFKGHRLTYFSAVWMVCAWLPYIISLILRN